MIDLRNYATVDIVEELCRRDGVSSLSLNAGESCGYPRASTIFGPAKILIILEVMP